MNRCPWVPTAEYRPIQQLQGVWHWWDYETRSWLPETQPGHTIYRLQRELEAAITKQQIRLTRARPDTR